MLCKHPEILKNPEFSMAAIILKNFKNLYIQERVQLREASNFTHTVFQKSLEEN